MDNAQNNIPETSQIPTLPPLLYTAPPFFNQIPPSNDPEQSKNIDSINDVSAQINQENNNEEHKKRKRATKKESDIRNFKCPQCDKSYLSYPALYTHCKQKHNTNNHSGRNRGRPKKDPSEMASDKNLYDPQTPEFFKKEERTGETPLEKINECVLEAFKFIYVENAASVKSRQMKEFEKVEEHPFLGAYMQQNHNIDVVEDEKKPTDKVLMDYLNKTASVCNEKYFEKIIVFVTLFRENVNMINKMEGNEEYTMVKEAEDVPEKSNEFITDFLFPEEEEKSFGFDKEESINLTRNLCNWMYIHNFTCSKLFLI